MVKIFVLISGEYFDTNLKIRIEKIYVSLRLRVQNAGPAEPCVGKY